MAPVCDINVEDVEPMSRTYQYRKVMKPMLERKRRARINKCLDELKDLMVGAMQDEGESITKLEKADVLELTVNHLKKLKKCDALKIPAATHSQEKFNLGFRHCTNEVSKFVNAIPGIDVHVSNRLMSHLRGCTGQMERFPGVVQTNIQPSSAVSPITVSIPSKMMYTPPASPDCMREQKPVVVNRPVINNPPQLIKTIPQNYNHRIPQQPHPLPPHHINNYRQIHNTPAPRVIHHTVAAPPSPPLSVGSPSPVHHLQQYSAPKSVSPQPTPIVQNYKNITDASVWRPW